MWWGRRAGVFRSAIRNKKESQCFPRIGYGPDRDVYFEKGRNAIHVGWFNLLFYCLGCRVSGWILKESCFFKIYTQELENSFRNSKSLFGKRPIPYIIIKMVFTAANILLTGSILIFISILIGKTGYRFGIPTLLLFITEGARTE